MKNSLILALDIGSSSVRASLYDGTAQPLPKMSVRIEHSFTATKDGGSEMDAEKFLSQIVAAVDSILKRSVNTKGDIVAVAMCSFWHSLVGVDAKGKQTTKLLGWADTRSREYSASLKKKFDEKLVHNRTGAHFHSSFWPAKLLWLRREFPDKFARTAMWLSFSDYVALKLFGEAVTSVSMASATGIFDQRKCAWDDELLRYLKVSRRKLPLLTETDAKTYHLKPSFIKRWPRLANAKWFPAIGDGAADNIGAECTTKKHATLMIGTSAAMRVAFTGDPPKNIPEGLWCYRLDRKRVVIGGALSDGGNLYELIKRQFKLPANTDRLIQKRGPANDDLIVLPFFFGERSTGYNEDASGAIIGLKPTHDGIDILRAALEGVAFRLAEICERLGTIAKFSEIVASGGALRESPVWAQIIADVLERKLEIHKSDESSMRGAVIFALENIETIMNNKISTTAKKL